MTGQRGAERVKLPDAIYCQDSGLVQSEEHCKHCPVPTMMGYCGFMIRRPARPSAKPAKGREREAQLNRWRMEITIKLYEEELRRRAIRDAVRPSAKPKGKERK